MTGGGRSALSASELEALQQKGDLQQLLATGAAPGSADGGGGELHAEIEKLQETDAFCRLVDFNCMNFEEVSSYLLFFITGTPYPRAIQPYLKT